LALRLSGLDHVLKTNEAHFLTALAASFVWHRKMRRSGTQATHACFRLGGFRSGRFVVVHVEPHTLQE
jgi:hypothetical protein